MSTTEVSKIPTFEAVLWVCDVCGGTSWCEDDCNGFQCNRGKEHARPARYMAEVIPGGPRLPPTPEEPDDGIEAEACPGGDLCKCFTLYDLPETEGSPEHGQWWHDHLGWGCAAGHNEIGHSHELTNCEKCGAARPGRRPPKEEL